MTLTTLTTKYEDLMVAKAKGDSFFWPWYRLKKICTETENLSLGAVAH